MHLQPCGHVAAAAATRLCQHLVGDEPPNLSHKVLLSGRGLEGDMCCPACAALDPGDRSLLVACEGCVARVNDDHWGFEGWLGTPGIRDRPVAFHPKVREAALPAAVLPLMDIQP